MTKAICLFCEKDLTYDIFFPFCPQCHNPVFLSSTSLSPKPPPSSPLSLEQLFPSPAPDVSLGEGNTPLLRLSSLENQLGLPSLWAKNEGLNPTGTFKDRGSALALQQAKRLGIKKIGTVSVGNMAASTAAYGARAGLDTFILVRGDVEAEKLNFIQTYNPYLIQVAGDYGELFEKSYELGRVYGIYFINSVDPLRMAGYKTTAREILLQFAPEVPEVIVIPVSSGGHFLGIFQAFLELKSLNFLHHLPFFIGVQSERCAPLAQAYARKENRFSRIYNLPPVPYAISNPNPPGGNLVLKLIYQHQGCLIAVNDEEIKKAQRLLALEEGLFVLPSSAATLAGLLRYLEENPSLCQKNICLILTGSGGRGKKLFSPERTRLYSTTIKEIDRLLMKMLEKN
jgi:threonine synthase